MQRGWIFLAPILHKKSKSYFASEQKYPSKKEWISFALIAKVEKIYPAVGKTYPSNIYKGQSINVHYNHAYKGTSLNLTRWEVG